MLEDAAQYSYHQAPVMNNNANSKKQSASVRNGGASGASKFNLHAIFGAGG